MSERAPAPAAPEQTSAPDTTLESDAQDLRDNLQDQPETVASSPEEEAIKLDDKEILGQSGHLRRELHDTTRGVLNTTHENFVALQNRVSGRKNSRLERRRDRAKQRYEHKQLKLGTSHFKFWNRHHERVANAYRARYEKASGKFDSHTDKMKGRTESAEQASTRRNEAYGNRIDFYTKAKVEAERRKILRKLEKQKRNEGMEKMEAHRFIQNLSPADKRRITRQAIEAIRQENIRKGILDQNYVVTQ